MENTKMTYVKVLTMVLNGEPLTDEAKEKLTALKEREEKRSHRDNDKPTKKQAENASLQEELLTYLATFDAPVTVSDFIQNVPKLEGTSYQKVSAMFRALEAAGKIVKTTEKRKSYFAIAG